MGEALAITLYEFLSFVHVSAVVIALGPTFAFPVIQMTAEKRYPHALPFALRVINRISKGMVVPVVLVVGATGIYQALDGPFKLGEARWLDIGLTLYLILVGIALWVYRPSVIESAAQEAERMIEGKLPGEEVALSEDYARIMRLPNAAGMLLSIITLVIIYLMVVKPSF